MKLSTIRLHCTNKILEYHSEQRIQPLQSASVNLVKSLPRMRLLNSLSLLADLSSVNSFPHNLGLKYHSECLPYVIELYLAVENSAGAFTIIN